MKCLFAVFALALARSCAGATDDYHVEQVQSPFVSAHDPGTHMTSSGLHGRDFQGIPGDFGPYSSSSKHEFHEEQRFVNGQPIYEKRHERRYQDGRLVHEDGHEKGQAELGTTHLIGASGSGGYGSAGGSYRTSSRQYQSSSGGSFDSAGNSLLPGAGYGGGVRTRYGETGHADGSSGGRLESDSSSASRSISSSTNSHSRIGGEFEGNFRSDVDRLRQQLHQGTSVIRTPVTGSSLHEEKREEAHFVDGQPVYHRNEERKYEDGRLVHDVSEEKGPDDLGTRIHTRPVGNSLGINRRRGYESSSSQDQLASSAGNNNPQSSTSYRASYWRPGPQARTVSTNTQRQTNQVSTSYQPSASRITYTNTDIGPSQGSYRTSSNRIRTEGNKPAYRASYTPSRTVERVPQRSVAVAPVSSSQVSTSSSHREYSSSTGYRSSTTRPITSQSRSDASEYQTSYSNKPDISYRPAHSSDISQERTSAAAAAVAASSYQPAPHPTYPQQPTAPITSTATRRQFSTAYGSGSYVRPTESPITSQTTSRITDTYSEPYSVRSSSYQPSRFANYSAWTHWNEDSGQPSHIISSENTRESNYRTSAVSNQMDDSSYSGNTNIGNPSSATTSQKTQQSQHVRAFRPGFLYDENEIDDQQSHSGSAGSESIRSQSSLDNEYSAGYPSSSYASDLEQSSSSRTFTSNTPRTTDASIRAGSGSQVNLAFVVDVGEGDSIRLVNTGHSQSVKNQEERYDISPLVDGGIGSNVADNEVETEYGGSSRSSSINSLSKISTTNSVYNDDSDFNRNRGQGYGQSGYESDRRYESSGSGYRSSAVIPVSGSSFDRTTKVTNRTTNTMTSHIQPLVSSYKLETRTSRRYLNGKLVSETKFNRYYENGILVHENQTERSRDEMVTDGIDVTSFDLTTEDLARYGMIQSGSQPAAHSQRFEMRQEKEFVDGDQVYEATHERHYQDGELIHEDHNEKDHDELVALGRTSDTGIGTYTGITGQVTGGGAYTSNFIENRNYGNSFETGTYDGLPRVGTRQSSGVGETVTVSVSPRTRTRKTEVRQEQEYRDGQQVFDLRHERRFDDGQLVHEDLSEKGPEELGAVDHTDALADILSGRTLATASQTGYRPSPAAVAAASRQSQASRQQNYQENAYYTDDRENSLNADREYIRSQNRAYDAGHEVGQSSYRGATVEAGASQRSTGLVGTNLLTSGCLTCVIGSSGAQQFDSLSNAQSLSTGNSASSAQTTTSKVDGSNANQLTRSGGGYYAMVGNSGSGHDSARSSSSGYSSETSSSQSFGTSGVDVNRSNRGGSSGYEAAGNFEAYSGGPGEGQAAVTHRREMEVEEHYENGQLVRGREEDKEWSNNQLIKHDNRNYGEGGARTGSSYSSQRSPGLSSSSSFDTYGGTSSREGANFGATATFGAERSASYGGGATQIGGVSEIGQGGVTHRREMEVEEHYENGRLVHGREEDKEWKNEQLLRHDHRRYGEGDEEGRPRASALSSSSAAHSSSGSSSVFPHSEVGECSALPCRNGGSCIVGMKGYLCVCTFGFRGSVCEEAYCPTRYCRHDGICQVAGDGSHSCSCPVSHTGPRCEHRVRNRGVN